MNNRQCILNLYVVVIIALVLFQSCKGGQPPYQVSLYVRLHPKANTVHLCNGIILQSRVILTSASCMYYEFDPNSSWITLHTSKIFIVAGNADAFNEAVINSVSEINVLDTFNSKTMENDLAIVRLSTSLPLGFRADMNWIVLDDDEFNNNPCLANFYARNSLDNVPDYAQMEELPILDSMECVKASDYTNRFKDLCSFYTLPFGFDCKLFDEFILFNGDRGTGLVCNSRLVGILSTILPLPTENITNCSELDVKTFYTNIGPHLDWIYSIIAYEEYMDITRGNYTASAPYHQEASAMMKPPNVDIILDTLYVNNVIYNTTTKDSITTTISTATLPNFTVFSGVSNLKILHLMFILKMIIYFII